MKIAAREQQILRVQEASFHPQMNKALGQQIRAEVITTVKNTNEPQWRILRDTNRVLKSTFFQWSLYYNQRIIKRFFP